jgi:hypothetical protein
MEKLFVVTDQNGKLVCESENDSIELVTEVAIPAWTPIGTVKWCWKLTKVANTNATEYPKQFVAELFVDGVLRFATKNIRINAGAGVGLFLSSVNPIMPESKPKVTIIGMVTVNKLKQYGCTQIVNRLPTVDRVRKANSTVQYRIFDLDGNEISPLAGGSFLLNPATPYVVRRRTVKLSRAYEVNSLYIPEGYKFVPDDDVKKDEKEDGIEDLADSICDAISHEETAEIPEVESEVVPEPILSSAARDSFGNIAAAVSAVVTINNEASVVEATYAKNGDRPLNVGGQSVQA